MLVITVGNTLADDQAADRRDTLSSDVGRLDVTVIIHGGSDIVDSCFEVTRVPAT